MRTARVEVNNPDLLRWARESAGYTLEDVGRWFGRPASAIEEWETGYTAPTARQLRELARRTRRPLASLFLPEAPLEPPLPEDFRSLDGHRPRGYSPAALLAFRELRAQLSLVDDLLRDLDEPLSYSLPRWPDRRTAPDRRAAELRNLIGIQMSEQVAWENASQALHDWRDALFDRGVVVRAMRFPLSDARAFSVRGAGLGGVGLTSAEPVSARIFSLFHEVAHLCLGRPGVSGDVLGTVDTPDGASAMERYCDRVSAAFLMPAAEPEVQAAVGHLATSLSRNLAHHYGRRFKVSKYAMALRALDLGAVDPPTFWREWETWREADEEAARVRRRSEGAPPAERLAVSSFGRRFVAKVLAALDAGRLSSHSASEMLTLAPDKLEAIRGVVLG